MSLPEWMLPRTTPDDWRTHPDGARAPSGRSRTTVRRALGAFARLIAGTFADDACAARAGLLQGIDARCKVVALIGLIVVTTLLHSLPVLAICCAACVAMAVASRVEARRLAGAWLVVPVFSAVIMLPATLNVVTDGRPVLTVCHFQTGHCGPWTLPPALTVTDAGLAAAGRMVLRSAVCVLLAALLTCTTRRDRLLVGLRALRAPRMFVMMLGVMERYLGVMMRAAEEVHLARLSRSIAPGPVRQEQAWAAAGIGSLFRRSHALGHAVYLAMISRGYTGEACSLDEPKWRRRDWAFLMAAAAFGAVVLGVGR